MDLAKEWERHTKEKEPMHERGAPRLPASFVETADAGVILTQACNTMITGNVPMQN